MLIRQVICFSMYFRLDTTVWFN